MKKVKALIKDKVFVITISIFFVMAIITTLSFINYSKIRESYPEKVTAHPTGMQISHHDRITYV